MTAFEPFDGWTEINQSQFLRTTGDRFTGYFDGAARYFVREVPVPALPTEHWTAIRLTWAGAEDAVELVLYEDGYWHGSEGDVYRPDRISRYTGFEVLAEPTSEHNYTEGAVRRMKDEVRRETAKAVLDRVRKVHHSAGDLSLPARFSAELDAIGRDYRVGL